MAEASEQTSLQHSRSSQIWTRDFILLMVIQTIDLFTYNMMTPVLAQYALELGIALALSGLLVSAFAFAALFARPFTGKAADILGRKRVVVVSIAVSLVVQVGYVFVTSFPLLVALRIVHGAFYALFGTAIVALATQSLPDDKQNEGMGWFGTSYVLANALGPALGVYLTTCFGFQTMFIVGASITALSLLLVKFVRVRGDAQDSMQGSAQKRGEAPRQTGKKQMRLSDFISVRSLPLAAVAAAFMTIWGIIITYVVMVGEARGILGMSLFFIVNSVMLLVTRPTAGKVADRRGLAPVAAFSVAFEFVAITLLTCANASWMFLVAAVCKAFGSGTVLPSVQANCGMLEPPERRGVAMATYLLGTDIGNVLGPMIGGVAAASFGLDAVFLPGYALGLICAAAFVVWYRRTRANR